nr:hypothetical protein [Escherichia coli]
MAAKISERLAAYGIITACDFYDSDVRFFYERHSVLKWNVPGGSCMASPVSGCMNPLLSDNKLSSRGALASALIHSARCMRQCHSLPAVPLNSFETMAPGLAKSPCLSRAARLPELKPGTAAAVLSRLLRRRTPATLVSAAGAILTRIYKPGIDYAKAGVMLSSMTDGTEQLSLFDERPAGRGSEALMKVMDRFNKEHRGSLFLACEGIHQDFRGSRPCCPHGIPLAGMSYLSSKPDVHAGVTRHGQFRKEKVTLASTGLLDCVFQGGLVNSARDE